MIARIVDNQWIYLANITDAEDSILWEAFSATRPGRYVDPNQMSNWDGVFRKYNRGQKRIARPLLSMLRGICTKHGLPVSTRDEREPWGYQAIDPEEIGADFLPGITLEQYQIDCIRKIARVECGVIDVPTGGGKGELIAGACKAIPCPTLILADQIIVVKQLKERLELRDVAEEVGMFYAGKRPNGQMIVIGSIQSLSPPTKPPELPIKKPNETDKAFQKRFENFDTKLKAFKTRRRNSKVLLDYVRKAQMLIVDECVHEDTLVVTDGGLERAAAVLDRLQDGQPVAARVDGKYHPITAWAEKTEVSVNVTTKTGVELRSSHNHPYAVFEDGQRVYRHAIDLRPGDLLLAPRPAVTTVVDDKVDAWYHLGLFIGDGHFLDDERVRFAVRKDVADWRTVGMAMATAWSGSFKAGFNKRGDFVMVIKSPTLTGWLKKLWFKPGRKMGSIDPRFTIPTTDAAAALLRGLFDAEGSAYSSSVTCDSIDRALMSFAQKLMAYLGIGSSVFVSNKRDRAHHAKLWRVAVNGENARKWRKLVGFGFSRKSAKPAVVSGVHSERRIDPQSWLARWRAAGLPSTKLARVLGICVGEVAPLNRNKVSLARLVDWQMRIDVLAAITPADYAAAKNLLGVSDAKVAAYAEVDGKTVWNRRQRGDDGLWRDYVRDLQGRLMAERVDIALAGYAVEVVKDVTQADPVRLIDFTVPGPACFEANGLLVHNCDKATSDPWKNLFRHYFKGRRRYGFSGTPFDPAKPVEGLVMQEHLGSVIFQETRQHLTDLGRIIPCEYHMLAYGIEGDIHEASAYDIAYNEHMVDSVRYHTYVAKLAKRCKRDPMDGTLVIVDRETLGYKLEEIINQSGLRAKFIFGKTPPRKRDEALRAFERREYDVLIGGKIINRGLDLAGGCENLIIASGGKLQSEFLQKLGRALRRNRRGESRIYDFFFRCNRYLYDHSKARLKVVINAGYPTKVVFPGGSIDGAELVRSRFQIKRKLLTPATPRLPMSAGPAEPTATA